MTKPNQLRVLMVFWLLPASLWALQLDDIRRFSPREKAALIHRYPECQNNLEFFTPEQFERIEKQKLAPALGELLLHPKIRLGDVDLVLDLAQMVVESTLGFAAIETRMLRYMKHDLLPFAAAKKAIERERYHQHKAEQIAQLKLRPSPFVKRINAMSLKSAEKDKLIGSYALCVMPYWEEAERSALRPKVCEPIKGYEHIRHTAVRIPVRKSQESMVNDHAHAYRSLVEEMQKTADWNQLDTFERMKMAKCVSEESMVFFYPNDQPFKTLKKLINMGTKPPEEAFFMQSGICGNFGALIYSLAEALGLSDRVFLTQKGIHMFLEFEASGEWYHLHPFNSQGDCDAIRF